MTQLTNALLSRIQRDLKLNIGETLTTEGKTGLREAIQIGLKDDLIDKPVSPKGTFEFDVEATLWTQHFAMICYHTQLYSTDISKDMSDVIEKHLIEFGEKLCSE